PRAERHPLPLRVAFQDSCHLAHAQRVRAEPRAALTAIPELELVEPAEQAICCGSAGTYNLVPPEAARELGDRQAGHVLAPDPVQQACHERHALQCGYCTPGMVMAVVSILEENPKPSESEIRHALEGNLCRCTGYHNIVRAVQAAAGTL